MVVVGLGALRNKFSDSHRKRTSQITPTSRYAELAVNLADIMTAVLLETYQFKTQLFIKKPSNNNFFS
ncbi:MAG: abortive infection family protein [Janthinobacterium lividum]